MRDLAFTAVMLGLLPLAAAQPFVGVLLWSWVSFMNPHQMMWGFASGVPWALLVFGTTVLGCLLAREPRHLTVNAVTVLLALFLVCITLTSLVAIVPPVRVWEKWEWVSKVLLGLLLTAALLNSQRRIHALVWLMVISIGFFGVKGGAFTLLTGGAHIVMGPPNSPIGDRNQLSVALLVAIPLMNYLRLQSRHRIVRQGLVAAMAVDDLVNGGVVFGSVLGLNNQRGLLVAARFLNAALQVMEGFCVEVVWQAIRMRSTANVSRIDFERRSKLVLAGIAEDGAKCCRRVAGLLRRNHGCSVGNAVVIKRSFGGSLQCVKRIHLSVLSLKFVLLFCICCLFPKLHRLRDDFLGKLHVGCLDRHVTWAALEAAVNLPVEHGAERIRCVTHCCRLWYGDI